MDDKIYMSLNNGSRVYIDVAALNTSDAMLLARQISGCKVVVAATKFRNIIYQDGEISAD